MDNGRRPGGSEPGRGPVGGHAQISAVGRLTPDGEDRFNLDYGAGQIVVLLERHQTTKSLAEYLTEIPTGSIVAVAGPLGHHQWETGDGQPRQSHVICVRQVSLLYDARRDRMLL